MWPKNEGPKNPTNSYTVHYRSCLAFLLLISLSLNYRDWFPPYYDFLLSLLHWLVMPIPRTRHSTQHSSHSGASRKYSWFIYKLCTDSDSSSIPSNTQQWVWLCSKNVCCSSTSSYPSAVRTRLPIRRSGKSKT